MRSAAPLLVGFFFGWPADASYRICVPEARHVLGPENSQWFLRHCLGVPRILVDGRKKWGASAQLSAAVITVRDRQVPIAVQP